MSISASPLITDWIIHGLEFQYHLQPKRGPFIIPPNGIIQVPSDQYTFKASEGALLYFGALFHSPLCGVRFECSNGLDTENNFTVDSVSFLGAANTPFFVSATIHPKISAGLFSILNSREILWTNWARLSLINLDSIPQTCIGYAYMMATLSKPRPTDTIIPLQSLEKVRLAYEMYPEYRDSLKAKLSSLMSQWVREAKPETLRKEEER